MEFRWYGVLDEPDNVVESTPSNSEHEGGKEVASQGGAGTHPAASDGGDPEKSMTSVAGAQASMNKMDEMTSEKLGGRRQSTKKSIKGGDGRSCKKSARGGARRPIEILF